MRRESSVAVTWRRNAVPMAVLAPLERARSIGSSGNVTYSGFSFHELSFLLDSVVDLGTEIPIADREALIRRALFAPASAKSQLKDTFLQAVEDQMGQYWRQPVRPFTVVSGISAQMGGDGPRFRVHTGEEIAFARRLPRGMSIARTAILRDQTTFEPDALPSNYRRVLVSVGGRTVNEAVDRAIDAVDLFRAIWNFYFNRLQSTRWSNGLPDPVNRLVLHPIHTVHELGGTSAAANWWYQPEYRRPSRVVDLKADWPKLTTFTKRVRAYLGGSRYRDALCIALRQYVRALDRADMADSFARLWAVLELLTATGGKNYDVTIKRTSFHFADRELATTALEHLRRERNRLVHEGRESHSGEMCVYKAKSFVETLLEFHIRNRFRFESFTDAASFFDLPHSLDELRQHMTRLKGVQKYHRL